eukprot:jgi/Botrbrau1/3279/Bobra.174_1s0045.1
MSDFVCTLGRLKAPAKGVPRKPNDLGERVLSWRIGFAATVWLMVWHWPPLEKVVFMRGNQASLSGI